MTQPAARPLFFLTVFSLADKACRPTIVAAGGAADIMELGGTTCTPRQPIAMLKSALPPIRSEWLRDTHAFLFSAICNLLALVALGMLSMASDRGLADLRLVAQIGDADDVPADVAALDKELAQFKAAVEDAATAAGPTTIFDSSVVAVSDLAPLDSPFDVLRTGGGLDGQSIGDGGQLLAGDASQAEFFGISGYGDTFVYVVDMSGSMSEHKKWERAREELLRSIEHLSPSQRYFVVFYSDGWYPMDAEEPIYATADHVDKTRRWVRRIWPEGGTYPLEALLFALRLQPDAIYFLSDGKFDPSVVDTLRFQNPDSAGQIPIHTISFVNVHTIGTMKTIARNSGGKFRFVK